jgi:thioester reductase-like protein
MNAPASSSTQRVHEFYHGKWVLVTGATGFVGKVVAEKLLRSVPTIGRILLLVRPKKKSTPDERFTELLSSSIFDTLREKLGSEFVPYARSKMEVIPGDLVKENMGMSVEHWELLTHRVQVILHNAATILFDEPLEAALMNNTFGALNVLRFSQHCTQLDCFVHCSTAYVNAPVQTPEMVREELYPTLPELANPEALYAELLATNAHLLAVRCKKILGRFPNT